MATVVVVVVVVSRVRFVAIGSAPLKTKKV